MVRRKLDLDRRIIGWKIGLNSKAMQDALKINIPDSGILFDDTIYESGSTVPSGRYIQPRVEAEIAFVVKSDLKGPNVGIDDVCEATQWIVPSLEILDTRILRADPITKSTRTIVDIIAFR